ncbi:unnamed protein product [Closterium sp. NIES-53]
MPTRDLCGVRELGTPGVRQATEAALGGVQTATLLSSADAGAQDVALLLLGSPLHSSASAGSTSAGSASASATPPATATAASSSTAATEAPTSATTPPPPPPPPPPPLPPPPLPPPAPLPRLALLMGRLSLGADAALTDSVPTRSTAAAEATEGERGTGEHPSKKGDVTFDESLPFYHLFPYHSAPCPPPPLFLAPSPPSVDPLPPQGPAPLGVSQVDPLSGTAPLQVTVVSGAAPGAASGGALSGGAELGGAGSEGAGSGGAEPEGVEPGGAESEGAEPGGAESEGAESGGAEPRGATLSGGPAGASPRLSSQQLREWLVQRPHRRSGAPGAGEPGDAGAEGAAITTRAGDPTEPGETGAGGAGAGVAGVGGPGAGGAATARAGAIDPAAGGAGGTLRPRKCFVPLLQQVLGVPSSTGLPPPFLCPPPDQTQPLLQPASPVPVPSPYTEQSRGLIERHEPASRPVSLVRTARRDPRSRPPPIPRTHTMALRPSSVPLRVPLPAPPESYLPEVPDSESDRARAASPTVACLLATAVTDPSFESAAASALVAELLDFAAACRLDYASALVAESVPASPLSDRGECALGTDVLEAAMDAEMASWKSTGTYVDEVPPPGVNIVDGMWIFRVKRPVGSPPAFKARYVARAGLRVTLPGLQYSLPAGQPAQGDLAALTTWFHWVVSYRNTLAALGFVPSTADPSLFLRTDTSLPPFYVLVYVYDLVFPTADTEALTLVNSELQKRHTCTDLGELRSYLGLQITRDRARRTVTLTQSHMVHQSIEPSGPYPKLVGCLISSSEAEIYAGAMAAQELRWLTYLLTDLGEQPRSPPVLYVDNKAMIALCQELRLEHRMKHIALRYFLARELQQCGQLRLAYVATRANTADVFTKALPPGDHQRFLTVLGLLALHCFFS